ncbi:hypothetical protein J1N35_045515 [Gossypium stocksii]|uniref:Uncharacterized protein n=1 Tax=Gossypium stocksii TaxID=47602 RepID=A0A9D3UB63_9ROSI|nr:hypothetical protein J1N35_045515 [Gossypium stocksii]
MPVFSSRVMFRSYDQKLRKERSDRKSKLSEVFKSYASNGVLDKESLKDAFLHLDAAMPYRQAEEALRVVGKSYEINVHNETDLNTLVDYAYNKGYGWSSCDRYSGSRLLVGLNGLLLLVILGALTPLLFL